MPEIRKDPVFGRWAIIAAERGGRPNEFRPGAAHTCPFCAGNEEHTPPTIYSLPGPGGAWRQRVVRNKYPALEAGGSPDYRREGIYDCMDGLGLHEVIIETPRHDARLEELPESEIADLVRTFALRVREFKKDPGIKFVMLFKNHGRNAGASLLHPHSQVVAMPMAPLRVLQEIEGAARYHAEKGNCVFCDVIKAEAADRRRVVFESQDYLAFAPYASRFSFETWLLPRAHASHFEDLTDAGAAGLAAALKAVLGKLYASLPELAYNLIIHTMPVQEGPAPHYHWHVEIMPKLSQVAGFEWGTGFYINTVSPEEAAGTLNAGRKFRF